MPSSIASSWLKVTASSSAASEIVTSAVTIKITFRSILSCFFRSFCFQRHLLALRWRVITILLQSFSFRYNWSFRFIEYIVIHLHILREIQKLNDLFSEPLNNSFVSAVAIPYRNLITIVLDRDNNSAYFIFVGKLLSNDSEDQIFPEFVCEPLLYSEGPSASILVCLILPHRLDAFHKLNKEIILEFELPFRDWNRLRVDQVF